MRKYMPSPSSGFYYNNALWYSQAYQSLSVSGKNLLHCFINELRWTRKGKMKKYTNNDEISFTEIQFKKLFGSCSQTFINARNQLIMCGLIKQTYRGGNGKGDMARYRILCVDGIITQQQRWKNYPENNWSHEIPKDKNSRVGVHTRFKKGKSGRKLKSTLKDYTLNSANLPKELYPYKYKAPIKPDPYKIEEC